MTHSQTKPPTGPRPIRSYVLRTGRLTNGQQDAIQSLWSKYGIDATDHSTINQETHFGRDTQFILEIGFGMGTSLAEMASNDPNSDYLGIEVHTPGLGNLLKLIDDQGIQNLKVMSEDATDMLSRHVTDETFDKIHIYFPDPWPKKRHHKRRIIQTDFIQLLAKKLKPHGIIHLATDWQEYAMHMAHVMQSTEGFSTQAIDGSAFVPRPDSRPMTKFEQRGINLGHGVWDLIYTKTH